MTTIELTDTQAEKLKAWERSIGLTLGEWIDQLPDQSTRSFAPDRPIWEIIPDNMKDVPEEEYEKLPSDGASQVDPYLYGHPKR